MCLSEQRFQADIHASVIWFKNAYLWFCLHTLKTCYETVLTLFQIGNSRQRF